MFFHNGSRNRGCEAIVRSGVALLKGRMPGISVDLASRTPETDRIIPLLDRILPHKQYPIKKYSLAWWQSALRLKLFGDEGFALRHLESDIIRLVGDYDVFLSIGGDNYCYGEQPGVYEIDRNIKKAGKKLVLWGASIGEEDLSPAKVADLKTFDLILVRETLSLAALQKHGLSQAKLVTDGAFLMEKELLPLPEGWTENNTVGLNFSPLVAKMNPDARRAVQDLIVHILETTDMTIALTPHVGEPGNDDMDILQPLYDQFKASGRVILLPDTLNAIQLKGYISRMRFFVGARTHATIAAYSTGVPTMVLGYSIKSKGIARDIFGEEKLVLGLKEISDSTRLKLKFDEMVAEEADLRRTLGENIPRIREQSAKAAEYLDELIGS